MKRAVKAAAIGFALLTGGTAIADYEDLIFLCKVEQVASVHFWNVEGETVVGGDTRPLDLVWVIGAGMLQVEDLGIELPCKFSESLIRCTDEFDPELNFVYHRRPNAWVLTGYYAGTDDGKENYYVYGGTCEQQ